MNEKKMVGKRSVLFSRPPIIIGAGSVAGEKEGNGAFGKCFDMVEEDPLFGLKRYILPLISSSPIITTE